MNKKKLMALAAGLHYSTSDAATDKADSKKTFPIYLECLKPSWRLIIIDFIAILFDALFELLIPFLSGLLIKNGIEGYGALTPQGAPQPIIIGGGFDQPAMYFVWLYGGLMIGCALLAIACQIVGMKLSAVISSDYIERLRNTIFYKAEQFSFSNIGDFPVSKLTTMLSNDCNNIRFFVLMFVRMGFKQSMMAVLCFVFIFTQNWLIGAIALPLVAIAFAIIVAIIRKTRPQFIMTQSAIDNVNRNVEEDTEGIREVKAFCREGHMQEKFEKANGDLTDITFSSVSSLNMSGPITTFTINAVITVIQLLGGFSMLYSAQEGGNELWTMFNNGNPLFDAGELSMLTSYAAVLTMSFSFLSMLVQLYSRAQASKERIDRVLCEKIDISYDPKPKTADFDPDSLSSGEVEFKDALFSYLKDPSKPAVGPISLKIPEGQKIGIIGGTGSGKSSLVNLIPRLYDVTQGSVLIAGHDVRDYSVNALRGDIGVVLQNNVLFTGTIRSNICWGKKDATDEEIDEALKVACAYDFVHSFKDGLDTPVVQGGKSVSGGQKQRLCIARAVIKKPKILILDDSVSACDMDTSRRIQENLANTLKGTTVFMIAQRIDSIKRCDKILVLDNGHVAGYGTHEELLKNCKLYAEIDEIQAKGVE